MGKTAQKRAIPVDHKNANEKQAAPGFIAWGFLF